jgi:hypothetical protein
MSSVTGGAPVRLTNDATSTEYGGAWSPDASWFAYLAIRNGKMDLMKVKASGQAAPALVYANPGCLETPSWSPAGDWIQCGSQLISPDGQASRKLPVRHTQNYVFSKDGKLLYGLRDDPDHEVLFSVNVATGFEKTLGNIGREFRPNSNFHPALRFSLSPDGKSFVYPAGTFHSNLWMLTGALAP